MNKQFWIMIKEIWIHKESAQELQSIENALDEIDSIFTSDTETKYSKNLLKEE